MRASRVAAILILSFLFGGSSAEMAVQTSRAIARARAERRVGSAGDLVTLEVRGEDGETIARPRLVTALGRPTHLLLRDPLDPERVRLSLRVETVREPTGDVAVEYLLEIPAFEILASGRVLVTPGVELPLDLGGTLHARLLTLPVPSAAFDAYLEAEAQRPPPPNAI